MMRRPFVRPLLAFALALALAAGPLAFPAYAQTPPAGGPTEASPAPPPLPDATVKPEAASAGKTEVATHGFATGLPEEEEQYASELSISLGGLFTSGNAQTIALTSAGRLRLRRYEHQITAGAAANFARAAQRGEGAETTVENYQGLGRYDYFVSERVSLFTQATARHDRFQGLDLRSNIDPGVAYHFIQTKNQRLVAELGYDLQHDVRRDETRLASDPPSPKTQTLHNARGFFGYENRLYPQASFLASFEHIQNWEDPAVYRLIFDVGIKSNLRDNLAVAMTYTMRYENRPLPDVETTDSLASIALVYTFF
jgi:putative salt-induced outer membrane protein